MKIDELKPDLVVRGPLFPESVEIIVTVAMGDSVKLVGKGLDSGEVGRRAGIAQRAVWERANT